MLIRSLNAQNKPSMIGWIKSFYFFDIFQVKEIVVHNIK